MGAHPAIGQGTGERRDGFDGVADLAGQQRLQGRAAAAIGHMFHLRADL